VRRVETWLGQIILPQQHWRYRAETWLLSSESFMGILALSTHPFGQLSHFDLYGVWSFGRFHGMVLCAFHFLDGSIDISIFIISYVLLPPSSLFTRRYVVYAINCAV
jgi:hypothetical protein